MDEDDDDDDEDNEFMEDELIDLEMAVLENFDKSMDKSLSEAQVCISGCFYYEHQPKSCVR